MKAVKFPDMRMNVLVNLQSLGDIPYQEKVWVRHEKFKDVQWDSFDEAVHCLFDDSCFEEDPRRTINSLLFDEEEADNIKKVMALIDGLFDKYGKELSDDEYIHKPEWPKIVASANEAFATMRNNDLRYMDLAQRADLYSRYGIENEG